MTFVDKLLKDQRECRCNNCADCTIANLKLALEAERAAHAKTRGELAKAENHARGSDQDYERACDERDAALKELEAIKAERALAEAEKPAARSGDA